MSITKVSLPVLSTAHPPRVSVVIPCYNAEAWIARAIESVLRQDYPDLEIIVIDDGSTDSSLAVIRSFQGDVHWRSNANQGPCRARNQGMELATGEFIVFLDADDYFDPGSLRDWVKHGEEADVVFGPFAYEKDGWRTMSEAPHPNGNAISVACDWLRGAFTPACAVLWRASFVRSIGGWEANLLRNQDGELAIRGLLSRARVRFANGGCGVYVQHLSAERVSRRAGPEVRASELCSLEKLWALAQPQGSAQVRDSFAVAFYRIAYDCFANGVDNIGYAALSRARDLGLKGHIGPLAHRSLSGILGLRNKLWLTATVKRRPNRATRGRFSLLIRGRTYLMRRDEAEPSGRGDD